MDQSKSTLQQEGDITFEESCMAYAVYSRKAGRVIRVHGTATLLLQQTLATYANIDTLQKRQCPPLGRHPRVQKAADDLQKDNSKRIRINYSLAAAAMLPAIFVQVPGGLAVSGSLVAGINSANQITRNTTGNSTLTAGDVTAGSMGSNIVFTVGYSVVQVAIGITVGIFLAGIVVYPFGNKAGGKWGSGKNLRSGVLSY